jgi:hypothetical protein
MNDQGPPSVLPLRPSLHLWRDTRFTCDDALGMDGDGPRFGAMIALVAVVVATVILVFFGIGYALGRLFL